MFALASDLLHDVRVDVQGPHLVIPDRCVQSRSARAAGSRWHVSAGLALHGGPDAASPLTSKAAIDVTIGHVPAGIAHGRAPSPGRHRGPAGRREEPHARGVRAEPSAAGSGCDSLSVISSAGRCGPSRREPARLLGPVLRGRYEHAPGTGVTRKCPRGWNLPRPANVPKSASMVDGLPCGPQRAAAVKIAVTRFKISTSSRWHRPGPGRTCPPAGAVGGLHQIPAPPARLRPGLFRRGRARSPTEIPQDPGH